MATSTPAVGYIESVAHQLRLDQQATGERWWRGPHSDFIVDLADAGPFIVALAGVIEVLREGRCDPQWVLGTTTPKRACGLVGEWLDAGVEADVVADWLRAGCCEPRWARKMERAGITPTELLDVDGRPAHMVDEGPDFDGMPLARAVAEEYVDIGWAVKYLAQVSANGVG